MRAFATHGGESNMKDMVLILNYSNEFSLEIARRLRDEQICALIVSGDTTAGQVREMDPRGVILSGDAMGESAAFDAKILELDIPVLAMGHAAQALLTCMGGACAGEAIVQKKCAVEYGDSELFTGISNGERYIKKALTLMLPPDVRETAAGVCTIAFEHTEKKQYGVQFELERNDPEGTAILYNFAQAICGCGHWWTLEAALEKAQAQLEKAAAKGGSAVCAVSGGVDSTVAALLAYRAFGDKMKAIFVDTGLMREGEAEEVEALFEALEIPLVRINCAEEILSLLANTDNTEEKRAIVVRSIHEAMLNASTAVEGRKTLVLGTNYSDYLESGSSACKWQSSGMIVVEPLLDMFKHEVRAMAQQLGMGEEVVDRKPFPALGLGARIVGKVTAERLNGLRAAEAIFREEIREAGLERKLYKHFPVLLCTEAMLGSEIVILRAVTLSGGQLIPARLPHDLVERTVERIMAAMPAVSRVFYDQTPTSLGKESFE